MERTNIGLLLAKIESTYGTDPTPTGGSNAIAVARNTVKYGPKFQQILRMIEDGSFSRLIGMNVLPEVDLSFSVELRGNYTDGSTDSDISSGASAQAIEIDCLLRACDLAPTYTAETTNGARDGYVTYKPTIPSGEGDSVTFYFYSGLKLHKITGAKGTMKVNLKAGEFGMIDFNFTGLYNAPTDVALSGITPTWLPTKPPIWTSSSSVVDAISHVMQKFDLDLGNKIVKREDANSTDGVKGFINVDRESKCSIDPESVLEATHPIWADLATPTKRTIIAKIGSVTGNKCWITVVAVSQDVSYGDRGGMRTQAINYSIVKALMTDTNGAELQLKFF